MITQYHLLSAWRKPFINVCTISPASNKITLFFLTLKSFVFTLSLLLKDGSAKCRALGCWVFFPPEHRISDLCCFYSEAAVVTWALLAHESPDVFFLLLLFIPCLWFFSIFLESNCKFINLIFGVYGCVSYQFFKNKFHKFYAFFEISSCLSPNSNTTVTLDSSASVSLISLLTSGLFQAFLFFVLLTWIDCWVLSVNYFWLLSFFKTEFYFLRQGLTVLLRLTWNSWTRGILLPQPPHSPAVPWQQASSTVSFISFVTSYFRSGNNYGD